MSSTTDLQRSTPRAMNARECHRVLGPVLHEAHRAVERVFNIEGAKHARDLASVCRAMAAQARAGTEIINSAVSLKIKAERAIGEMLEKASRVRGHGGDRRSSCATKLDRLKDFGLTGAEAYRCRLLASIPQDLLEAFLAKAETSPTPLTVAGAVCLAKKVRAASSQVVDEEKPASRAKDRSKVEKIIASIGEHVEAVARSTGELLDQVPEDSPLWPRAKRVAACASHFTRCVTGNVLIGRVGKAETWEDAE